jgi:hypothetical protein
MKFKKALRDLHQTPQVLPESVAMAFEVSMPIDGVFTLGHLRYRLVERITRGEFLQMLAYNRQFQTNVAGQSTFVGSKVDERGLLDLSEPGPEFQFFYRAVCI